MYAKKVEDPGEGLFQNENLFPAAPPLSDESKVASQLELLNRYAGSLYMNEKSGPSSRGSVLRCVFQVAGGPARLARAPSLALAS